MQRKLVRPTANLLSTTMEASGQWDGRFKKMEKVSGKTLLKNNGKIRLFQANKSSESRQQIFLQINIKAVYGGV